MRVLFDPAMYEPGINQSSEEITEWLTYLNDVLGLLGKLNIKVAMSAKTFDASNSFLEHPWSTIKGCLTISTFLEIVYRSFMLAVDCDFLREESDCTALTPIQYSHHSSNRCFDCFLRDVAVTRNECPVFLGIVNHSLQSPLKFMDQAGTEFAVDAISDINENRVLLFSDGYRRILLADHTAKPSTHNRFPNSDLCTRYDELQQKAFEEGFDRVSVIRIFAKEVALRNNYVKDTDLTAFNSSSNHIRDVYRSEEADVLLCTDVRHGRFEAFDCNGVHIGEYTYAGVYIPDSRDSTGAHNLSIH